MGYFQGFRRLLQGILPGFSGFFGVHQKGSFKGSGSLIRVPLKVRFMDSFQGSFILHGSIGVAFQKDSANIC